MSTVELFEWSYSPPDYFEEPLEVVRDEYIMSISPGHVEARVDSRVYVAHPRIRDEIHASLNDRFLGVQLLTFLPYELSDSQRTRLHPNGRKDAFIEPKTGTITITGGTVGIQVTSADDTVISDTKAERVAAKRTLAELVQHHRPSNPTLAIMLNSFSNAIRDPQNELVHLYEVRDALSKYFGDKSATIATLGIPASAWSRLGQLSNDEPLRQGRHRGKSGLTLRDATHTELKEARDIARSMLSLYIEYLEKLKKQVGKSDG